MNFVSKRLVGKGFVVAIMLFTLSACGGKSRPFVPIEEGAIFKPARLAVISCVSDDIGKHFVAEVTKELQERTTFKVLSQKEITKKVRNYPFDIKILEADQVAGKPNWLDPSEEKTLKALQTKLKVDYIYVIWNKNLTHRVVRSRYGSSNYYYMEVFGNMFEFPKGKPVTFTDFSYRRDASILERISLKDSSFYVESLIEDSSKYLVDEFIKTTGSGKKS
jgi:hypothetical protein